jgi:hypothetical protein
MLLSTFKNDEIYGEYQTYWSKENYTQNVSFEVSTVVTMKNAAF